MPLEYRPDDDVIQDDAELDRWFERFSREMAQKAGKKGDPKYDFIGDSKQFAVPEFGV